MRIVRGVITLITAVTLAGCGVGTSSQPLAATSYQSFGSFAAERVPSDAELKRLEATSPDYLIDNAPAEPGADFWPKPPKGDLGNLGQLNERLYRGARPTDAGMKKLADMGVKTIVTLENDKKVVAQEKALAEKYGMRFHSIPMSIIVPPTEAKVDQFLAIAQDPAQLPVYFHCMQGRDRTGTMALAYRVKVQNWDYEQAYGEMKSYGFHTYLLGLKIFVKNYAKKYYRPMSLATAQ
ncbi:Tyrosine phosphatase family protein [compost metagenome]